MGAACVTDYTIHACMIVGIASASSGELSKDLTGMNIEEGEHHKQMVQQVSGLKRSPLVPFLAAIIVFCALLADLLQILSIPSLNR